ncbi:SusC/RagA family TonB-linked outer membrane protein [Albibacterium indicum]|uniref:SusC/RagA family TonB-linked outer membrane protein n=1 Tax=Albibacterium indicum TaxID=2292082 RepID=UPI000E472959|nr:TonB-dependent receptor [Pedobacter indicus]
MKHTLFLLFLFFTFHVGNVTAHGKKTKSVHIQQQIRGTVSDETGLPLPGVTVQVQGTQVASTTDSEGRYTIQAENGATLVFNMIGFVSEERVVDGSSINVVLKASISDLDEVVVVGYGTQRRRDLTGAISSVKAEDIVKVQTPSFTSAIQGKVPGVYISQTSGAPGSSASVRIRGVGTTGGNQPLYVVDGFPISAGAMSISRSSDRIDGLSVINPADIESIEVLKDAASAAIYGARAANGVILITTKRGKEGQARITLNSSYGVQDLWRRPEFLNAEQFATLANELYTNSGMTPNPEWADPASFGAGTNWIDQVFRTAPIQNYDFRATGGTEKLKASASLGYMDQQGTMIETGYSRYTGRFTADLTASDKLSFGGSLAYTYTQGQGQQNQVMNRGIFNLAQQYYPTLGPGSVIDGNSAYYTTQGDNPVLRAQSMDNRLRNSRVFGNVFGTYEIIPDLTFKSSVGIDHDNNRNRAWEPTVDRGHYRNLQAYLSETATEDMTWLIENTLSYSKTFSDHSLSAVVGQTAQRSQTDWITAIGREFANEQLQIINGSKSDLREANGTKGDYTLASYLARVNYAYKDKYLFSASIRRDGSSNFGPNNKWGNFPSVSAGWNISDEAFLADANFLNSLKIRASWGELGNDAIGAFGYLNTIRSGTGSDNYVFGPSQDLVLGASLSRPGNPDLKWETTQQTNIGIDATLFENAVSLTADYYIKNTKDMLVNLPVSYEAGFASAPSVNGGEVQNKGFEFALGYQKTVGDLYFSINGNFSTLTNVVKSLGVGRPINGPTLQYTSMSASYTEVGRPIGYYRGFVVDGIYQTNEEVNRSLQPNAVAGDFKFKDINGDNLLTDLDRVELGTPWPDIMYGANFDLTYKGFDFNLMLQGVAGNQIFHSNKFSTYPMKYFGGSGVVNSAIEVLDRWTPGSGKNEIPQLKYVDSNGNYANASSFYIEDGDYLRIRNVILGYSLPAGLLERTKTFKSVRLYVSAQNLFTFTNYSGFDPEVGSTNPIRAGIDDGVYPMPRTISFGLNLSL